MLLKMKNLCEDIMKISRLQTSAPPGSGDHYTPTAYICVLGAEGYKWLQGH